MNYDVILSKKDNKYSARIKKWPEIEACENTRDDAIQQVKTQLLEYLTQQEVEVVQIEIPLPSQTDNPWLSKFGWFKDDPTFDDLQAEIAAYRREIDKEMGLVE
jgi:predicted RNase H-like HicB family nuclease